MPITHIRNQKYGIVVALGALAVPALGWVATQESAVQPPTTTAKPAASKPTPPIPPAKPMRVEREVARGVRLIQEAIPAGNPEGPLLTTVVIVDPSQKGVSVEAALGKDRVWAMNAAAGREVVSRIAARHEAIAAINAAFFPAGGNPIGLHIQNGELVTEPAANRTCFLIPRNGKAQCAAFGYQAEVKTENDKETFALNGLNRRPAAPDKTGFLRSELLVFTPMFQDTTLKSPGRIEVVLEGIEGPVAVDKPLTGTVRQITEGGGTPLEKGTVVLSGSRDAAEWLKRVATPGTKLTVHFDLTTPDGKPFDGTDILHAVAGGPRLLRKGQLDIPLKDEGMSLNFSQTRHPRTAIGVTRDGKLLLLTVDGRQAGLSRGASLTEMAILLQRYGAVEAVNLDGGGSSACVVNNMVVNAPSDGRERPVASMLLVLSPDKPTAPPVLQTTSAPETASYKSVPVGQTLSLAAPKAKSADKSLWGIQPGGVLAGVVRQDGVFHALRPGTAIVTRKQSGGETNTHLITVLPPPTVPGEKPSTPDPTRH
ncbi:MAG: hypothetical protein OHK0029_08390 [Armatimonadaceae bacterium]